MKIKQVICLFLIVSASILPVLDLLKPIIYAQEEQEYYVTLDLARPYGFRGENINVTAFSSYSQVVLEIYLPNGNLWNNQTLDGNESRLIDIPSNAPFGDYRLLGKIPYSSSTRWFNVVDHENFESVDFPFYRHHKNASYWVYPNRTIIMIYGNQKLSVHLPDLPTGVSVNCFNNSDIFVVRFQSAVVDIDLSLVFVYDGVKLVINGTKETEKDFRFQFYSPKKIKKYGNRIKFTVENVLGYIPNALIFDWRDFVKAKEYLTYNHSTHTLFVHDVPETFSLDPSFGYDTIGSQYSSWGGSDSIFGCVYPLTENGQITNITWYGRALVGYEPANVTACIYGDPKASPLAVSTTEHSIGTTAAWYMFEIDYSATADDYWLCICSEQVYWYFDDGDTNQFDSQVMDYEDQPPDPWGDTHNWRARQLTIYANYTVDEAVAPFYDPATISTNTTSAGQPCLFSCNWTEGTGDGSLSHWVHESNNTGTLANGTYTSFGANTWSNETLTLNSSTNYVIQWRFHANDTDDDWNSTDWQYLTTTIILDWINGFEEVPDYNAWSGTITSGATIAVVDTTFYEGTNSSESDGIDAYGDRSLAYKDLGTTYQEIFVQNYINISSLPADLNVWCGSATYGGVGATDSITQCVYNISSSKWMIGYYSAGWIYQEETGTSSITLNEWFAIELRTYTHSSSGITTLWIDGVMKVNVTGLDLDDHGNVTCIGIGAEHANAYSSGTFTFYSDTITFSATYIGVITEYSYTFQETLVITSTDLFWRSIFYTQTESIVITSLFYDWGEYRTFFTETIVVQEDSFFWRSLWFIPSETIQVSDVFDFWRAVWFIPSETIEVIHTPNIWRALSFASSEVVEVSHLDYFWRSLSFTSSESIAITDLPIFRRALFYTFLEDVIVSDVANIWRAVWLPPFSESVVPSDLSYFWRGLSFTSSEFVVVSDLPLSWKALWLVQSEAVNLSEAHEFLAETYLVLYEFFEEVSVESVSYFWRALSFSSSESLILSDVSNFWRALSLTSSEFVVVSDLPLSWKALWFVRSETILISETHVILSEQFIVITVFLEEVLVDDLNLFWRAKFLPLPETASVTDVSLIWRAMQIMSTESTVASDLSFSWRALLFIPLEEILFSETHNILREQFFMILTLIEDVVVSDVANIWRALSFSSSELAVISDLPLSWRALQLFSSEIIVIVESHSMLSEIIIISLTSFEVIIVVSESFFTIGRVPVYVPAIPIIDIILIFICAWFFTIGHIAQWKKNLIWGIIAFAAWFIVAWLWLLIEPVSYFVAMIFLGMGLLILVTVLIGLLDNLSEEKLRGKELAD